MKYEEAYKPKLYFSVVSADGGLGRLLCKQIGNAVNLAQEGQRKFAGGITWSEWWRVIIILVKNSGEEKGGLCSMNKSKELWNSRDILGNTS